MKIHAHQLKLYLPKIQTLVIIYNKVKSHMTNVAVQNRGTIREKTCENVEWPK